MGRWITMEHPASVPAAPTGRRIRATGWRKQPRRRSGAKGLPRRTGGIGASSQRVVTARRRRDQLNHNTVRAAEKRRGRASRQGGRVPCRSSRSRARRAADGTAISQRKHQSGRSRRDLPTSLGHSTEAIRLIGFQTQSVLVSASTHRGPPTNPPWKRPRGGLVTPQQPERPRI
jgi:hypothetical protein